MAKRIRRPDFSSMGNKPAESAPAKSEFCAKCNMELEPDAVFCGECGTPRRAGVKKVRTMGEVRRNMEKKKNKRTIQSGRSTMFWLFIAHLVLGVIFYAANKKEADKINALPLDNPAMRETVLENSGISARELDQTIYMSKHLGAITVVSFVLPGIIFLGLFFWAGVNPLPATVGGLAIYLTFMVAGFAMHPSSMLSVVGWMIRLAIIGALTAAIKSASTERRIQEKRAAREALEARTAQRETETSG
jgi:hypothetical protein